ncbi:MFS transporter [Nocardia brasiliensis]|uniref:Putative multidrug resistance protein (Modular protein) n=1 Tax=Nocardia brasiliensis (strain ATCC 700358 / HUJEG-1) TaxID=1133849 RepID=K0ETJ2_NOCB7|nr:MFS transporter [Nocardia brasiliensis]AFU00752.1 putative multidrug resistance protein (modular protein) [Nocardia brasiliensis ATCC 700358]OCF84003.1 MFS transporter [Nocardia brasiliensis]
MTNSTTQAAPPGLAAGAATTLSHRQILTILSGLMLGMFLSALDQNIVSVAIVKIANDLHGFDEQAWATTAYLITATITTPLYGKLADIYGRKPFYLFAIGLFIIGSIACTFATSMYQLAGFRAFQGLGAGGLMSLAFTIIGDIVPTRERVRYQGYFMMVFGTATVLGPVLGGFFSDYETLAGIDGWRWVFLVNVPVGVLALAVVAKVLNVPHQRQDHRIDWFGAIALAICVVPLLIVAEQGRQWGWDSQKALICYGIGAVGLLLFLLVELMMKDAALIPLRLFRSSTFSVTIAGGFIVGIAMFGAITMVPQYFQVVRGFSPTKAGLLMLPLVLGITVGSQLAGRITKRTGRYKILPVAGCFIIAVGSALYGQVHFDSPLWQPLVYGGVIGLGLGGCMQTLIIAAQNAGPRSDMGVSTASATFFRQMGGTLGVAVFLTILFNLLPHRIIDAFGGQLPPGFGPDQLSAMQSNTSGIAALPDDLRVPILTGFTDAMHGVFLVAAGVALLACFVLMFMKEIPLQDDPVPVAPKETPRDAASSWDEDQVWEGAAQALSEPEPVLAGAVGSHASPERNGNGAYQFASATAGSATTVLAAADGYGAPGERSIAGYVRREDGHPVPGAALTLIDQRGHQVSRAGGDANGRYVIGAPEGGSFVLIVSAPGHQPAAITVSVGQQPQDIDLTLLGSGELSGVVRSAGRGTPLPGATITLTDLGGEVVGAAVTAADGAYVCHGIVSGTYTLVAVAEHMRPSATTLTVPDTGLLRHDIELAPMAVLAGAAWAEDGRVVPDAQISVLDATGDLTATARTDENGRYVVTDLPEGRYTIVARGYPPVTSQVTVAGGEVNHDVKLGYQLDDSPEQR